MWSWIIKRLGIVQYIHFVNDIFDSVNNSKAAPERKVATDYEILSIWNVDISIIHNIRYIRKEICK